MAVIPGDRQCEEPGVTDQVHGDRFYKSSCKSDDMLRKGLRASATGETPQTFPPRQQRLLLGRMTPNSSTRDPHQKEAGWTLHNLASPAQLCCAQAHGHSPPFHRRGWHPPHHRSPQQTSTIHHRAPAPWPRFLLPNPIISLSPASPRGNRGTLNQRHLDHQLSPLPDTRQPGQPPSQPLHTPPRPPLAQRCTAQSPVSPVRPPWTLPSAVSQESGPGHLPEGASSTSGERWG